MTTNHSSLDCTVTITSPALTGHDFQERELQKQLIQLQAQYNQSLEERKEKEALVF